MTSINCYRRWHDIQPVLGEPGCVGGSRVTGPMEPGPELVVRCAHVRTPVKEEGHRAETAVRARPLPGSPPFAFSFCVDGGRGEGGREGGVF